MNPDRYEANILRAALRRLLAATLCDRCYEDACTSNPDDCYRDCPCHGEIEAARGHARRVLS